jgi:hypothetical protein
MVQVAPAAAGGRQVRHSGEGLQVHRHLVVFGWSPTARCASGARSGTTKPNSFTMMKVATASYPMMKSGALGGTFTGIMA